jgi:predicted esterase
MNIPLYLKRIVKLINERIAPAYPISPKCIITVGTSGGGMAGHLFSFFHPDTVAGVISSVGYIHENSLKQKDIYPQNKICAFLTSPTDFNYKLMKEDKKFLDSLNWNTLWLEFEGGHRTAPENIREEALTWMLEQPEITDKL